MKRLLIFAALIVAIGSIGGNSLIAHAQTLTPSQTAALEQQLQVAKATLVNLEMQAGMVPTGDSGSASQPTAVATPVATTGLSTNEVSALRGTLSTLAAMLTQLNSSLAVNSTLTSAQQQVVQSTLTGMQSTLVAMANTITSAGSVPVSASAPVATTQPSSPVATNPSPSKSVAVNTPTTATTPAVTAAPVAQSTPAATAPQTAQASSFWSFTKAHWPTIVIILLVIAILAILFWPEKETVRTVSTVTSGSGKPKSAPTPAASTVTFSQNTAPAPAKPTTNGSTAPATPVASAVAAPSQK